MEFRETRYLAGKMPWDFRGRAARAVERGGLPLPRSVEVPLHGKRPLHNSPESTETS